MPELPTPHLHVPMLPPTVFGDSYDWMNALRSGWQEVSGWGLNGWGLGFWPDVIVCHLNDRRNRIYAVATYTKGDIEIKAFTNRAERDAETERIAVWHWRHGKADGPRDLPPEGEPLLPHHRGAFAWKRFRAERDQLERGGDQ